MSGRTRVSWNSGVQIEVKGAFNIVFDPSSRRQRWSIAFVSHGHTDHISILKARGLHKVASLPTLCYYESLHGAPSPLVSTCRYGQRLDLHELRVEVLNSGHIPGSCAFLVDDDQSRILYTGDVNVTSSMIQEGFKPAECDILVMESTYAHPIFKFPPREEVYLDILEWAAKTALSRAIPLLKCHPIGKAQELIALFNRHSNLPVVVDDTVFKTTKSLYKFDLLFFSSNTPEGRELLKSGDCVFISSKPPLGSSLLGRPLKKAIATGWAVKYKFKSFDAAFILSSHCDYYGLLDIVEQCSPRHIYTFHGYSKYLAAALRRRGYKAESLI